MPAQVEWLFTSYITVVSLVMLFSGVLSVVRAGWGLGIASSPLLGGYNWRFFGTAALMLAAFCRTFFSVRDSGREPPRVARHIFEATGPSCGMP